MNAKPQCTPLVNATAPLSALAAWPMPSRLVATAVAMAPSTCCRVFIMVEPSAFMRCGSEFRALVWLGDMASGTPIIKIT